MAIIDSLLPSPWELGKCRGLLEVDDPVHIWRKFVDGVIIQDSLSNIIENELLSSYEWQSEFFYRKSCGIFLTMIFQSVLLNILPPYQIWPQR